METHYQVGRMLGTSGNDVAVSSTVNIDLVSDLRRAD